jgi:ribose transport system permease protein
VPESTQTLTAAETAPGAQTLGANLRRFVAKEAVALLIALAILFVIFGAASPHFINAQNMINIGRAVAIMGIGATGVTMGLIGGVFDLSIASVADVTAVITSLVHLNFGLPPTLAMVVGLCVGVLCGAINGLLVTRFRINPIIATLGTAGVFRGIAFLLTGGQSHAIASEGFRWLGRTRVAGLPSPILVMMVVMVVAYVVMRHTRFGRNTYAIGGNPVASRLAGINVDRQRMYLFMVVSFCASLGGLVLLSKLGTMIPNASAGTELDTIAAAILGGTALSGGGGTIQGTLVGVLILGTLRNGLIINNVNAYWQEVASGIALITAVAIDRLRAGGYR